MKRRRHAPERIIRKLREAERMLAEGQNDPRGGEGARGIGADLHRWQSPLGPQQERHGAHDVAGPDLQMLAQQPRGAVRDPQLRRRGLQCRRDDHGMIDHLGSSDALLVAKAGEAVRGEPVTPLDHRWARDPTSRAAPGGPRPVSHREHDPCPLHMTSWD